MTAHSIQSSTGFSIRNEFSGIRNVQPDEHEVGSAGSLEKAIENLTSIVPGIQQMVEKVKADKERLMDNYLGTDEVASILLYTLEWKTRKSAFQYIFNNALGSDSATDKIWQPYLQLFLTALSKLPPSNIRTCYCRKNIRLGDKYSIGNIVCWQKCTLCTSSIQKLSRSSNDNEKYTIFIIDCDENKDLSSYISNDNQYEILIYPGRQFQVMSVVDCKNQINFVQLKEVQKNPQLIHIPKLPINNVTDSNTKYIDDLANFLNNLIDNGRIDLYKQKLNDSNIDTIIQYGIKQKKCKFLILSQNNITAIGAAKLAKSLINNKHLKSLSLSYNRLTDEGVKHLTQILSKNNNYLETLSLHSIEMTDTGLEYICEMLKRNKTLSWLHIGGNEISDAGVEMLTDTLITYENKLKALDISQNRSITDASADYFKKLFEKNDTLETLWMQECSLTTKTKEELKIAKSSNKRLFVLVVEKKNGIRAK